MEVKFFRLDRQLQQIGEELKSAICHVIDSGIYAFGPKWHELQEKWAAKVGQKYCLAVNNGTSALHIALKALTRERKRLVWTTPATFIATIESIKSSENDVGLIDIDECLTLDVQSLIFSDRLTRNSIFLPVSLHGNSPDLIQLQKISKVQNSRILLDGSQSHLAKLNGKFLETYCDITASSCYCTKNYAACGEGGLITTNNEDLYHFMVKYSSHGQRKLYDHEFLGFNFRMPEIICASLLVKLKYIDEWNFKRREIANWYKENLKNVSEISMLIERENSKCVYHHFPIFTDKRDKLKEYLLQNSIEVLTHYPNPCHLSPALKNVNYIGANLTNSERWSGTELSLPMFPELTKLEVDFVSEKIIQFYTKLQP